MNSNRVVRMIVTGIVLLFTTNHLIAQSTTVIQAARMIDVKSGKLIENPTIVVEGDRIKSIGSANLPTGAKMIQLIDMAFASRRMRTKLTALSPR